MKNVFKLSMVAMALSLAACSSDGDNETVVEEPVVETPVVDEPTVTEFGPYSTGTTSEPTTVYFDLDNGTTVELTAEEAASNTEWDIAFKRTNVYLNTHSQMYFTGNNADFYDDNGDPVVDNFVNATAESEEEDYIAVDYSAIPSDEAMWNSDVTEQILAGFYNYDSTTHQVSAADDKYYIVQSDAAFTKFRVSELVQAGFAMSSITFAVQHQADTETTFPDEQTFSLDLATLCAASDTVYVDFATQMEVTSDDEYDVMLPCADGGSGFDLVLADDATAIQDFANVHTGIAAASAPYYGFQPNEYTVKAFSETPWYTYNLQGGHLLWSQYGVYIIKTDNSHFKLQFTSYYDDEATSGHYSFRADELVAE